MSNVESPCLLLAVVDRNKHKRLEEILNEKHVRFQFLANAMGTAHSRILDVLGLSGTEKTIGLCILHRNKAQRAMISIMERMEMIRPGNGIVFTVPLTGTSKNVVQALESENRKYAERQVSHMEQAEINNEIKYGLVVAIVNNGFSENVMKAARESGVRGGTVLHVRQAAIEEASKFFGISLQPDKEMVLMIVGDVHKIELMQSINKVCGMRTDAHGMVISLPIDNCAGLTPVESY